MKLTAENKQAIKKEIGRRIEQHRSAQGLTLLELEVITGIDSSKLAKIEKGQIDFQVTKLVVIAHGLKVSLSTLYPFDVDLH